MARRRTLLGVLTAVAGVLAAVALTDPSARAAQADLWAAWSGLDDLVDTVQAAPGDFAGVVVDEAAGTVTVRYPAARGAAAARAGLTAGTDAVRVAAAAPRADSGDRMMRVSMSSATRSLTELRAVHKLVGAGDWLPDRSILASWSLDIRANVVRVGLTRVDPAVRAAAARAFGDAVQLVQEERARVHSRGNDVSPWAGGIEIDIIDQNTGRGHGCTSGFAIQNENNPSQQRMVTNSHCAPSVGSSAKNFGEEIGTIVQKITAQRGLDVAYIGGQQYSPFIYFGGPGSDVGRTTRGTITTVTGLGVCASGATTGQNCDGSVAQVEQCITTNRDDDGDGVPVQHTTCGLAVAVASTRMVVDGDSGGPVARFMGSDGAIVVGMIVAGSQSADGRFGMAYHPFTQLLPGGWRVMTG